MKQKRLIWQQYFAVLLSFLLFGSFQVIANAQTTKQVFSSGAELRAVDSGVITMTTSREVGGEIVLYLRANGDVEIDGVE